MGKGKKVLGTGIKADCLRRNPRRHWGVLDLVHLPSVESLMCAWAVVVLAETSAQASSWHTLDDSKTDTIGGISSSPDVWISQMFQISELEGFPEQRSSGLCLEEFEEHVNNRELSGQWRQLT